MLKIYFNEKSGVENKLKITIRDTSVKVEMTEAETGVQGEDIIEILRSYNSYAFANTTGAVKNYRKINQTGFKFLDLNRLGVSIRMDFADILMLYADRSIMQLDTGIISDDERDIIIRVFEGNRNTTEIDADVEYEVLTFNSDDLVLGDHPRQHLWDSYALEINGSTFMANRKGIPLSGDFIKPVSIPKGQNYVDVRVVKYKGDFEGQKLDRDVDDEEVMIDVSAGIANNRRIMLENGSGSFRLYPMGYYGPIKIKVGRRWYAVWNEYNLLLEEKWSD